MLDMFVCFFVSAIYLSDDGQDFFGLNILNRHSREFKWFDGQILHLHFACSAVFPQTEDKVARAREFGREMFGVENFRALAVLLYFNLGELQACDEGNTLQQVHLLVYL